MKNKYNKLTCLFGHHQYSDKITVDSRGSAVYMCKICKRNGYRTRDGRQKVWYDYNEKGNMVHSKSSSGDETWYNYDKGNLTHIKYSDGFEIWYDRNEEGYVICERWSTGHEFWYDGDDAPIVI